MPGGGLKVLGGTTSGLYDGKLARGTDKIGVGKLGASGRVNEGNTGGLLSGTK